MNLVLMRKTIRVILLIFAMVCFVSTFAEDASYFVYYSTPIPYSETLTYFETGKKENFIKNIPDLSILKKYNARVVSLADLMGENLPRYAFVWFQIQIEDSVEAIKVMQSIPNSYIIYDEMGYQELPWAVELKQQMLVSDADILCKKARAGISSSSVCRNVERTGLIVFKQNLSLSEANILVKELKKNGIDSKASICTFVEADL